MIKILYRKPVMSRERARAREVVRDLRNRSIAGHPPRVPRPEDKVLYSLPFPESNLNVYEI